ncbi:vacuolar protein sorting-associated protein 13B isoform X2 [Teleopsis dalmanni]|uniref:vacuolar protein sorting-associated protein 13B isoform X2 n=1 Tax=Teleopsis dalmanni TaxID=139649 RepID=UPI0018CF7C2E|nr:vacuolar protein sorting-associated protein 13B isoform X2 [Teleopsis dalmanni]
MFSLESYITPIILSHVDKYVKDFRPEDASISLWEGEAMFANLDLRLDVLEEELNLPIEFLSGHIYELYIFVPWTAIVSEPVRIHINTIEFVVKLKSGESSSTSSSPKRKRKPPPPKPTPKTDETPQQPPGAGLINKIVHNIKIEIENIILKYVEEDIVLSMNVAYLCVCSADENWKPAMLDVNPIKVLLRKLITISDLTICLDKRNSSGQIEVCMEPILYRCTLECRILRKHDIRTINTRSTTRIGIFTKLIDINISSLQFPLVMRLIEIVSAMQNDKVGAQISHYEQPDEAETTEVQSGYGVLSYVTWAWNLIPTITFDTCDDGDDCDSALPCHVNDFGFYAEQISFTLKNAELISDSVMGTQKRIRYLPVVSISLGGIYAEAVMAKERDWSSIKAGLSSIYIVPLAETNDPSDEAWVETETVEFVKSFIDKSLFDENCLIADKGWISTSYDDYRNRITDDYLMYRSPVLAFDVVKYKPAKKDDENQIGRKIIESLNEFRVLSAGITCRFQQTFQQVNNLINDLIKSYDYPPYYAEPLDANNSNVAQKLHPPQMEDYDALMEHIPLSIYKFDIKNIKFEFYAKVEPQKTQKTQRRLPINMQQNLPIFSCRIEHLYGTLSTPIKPNKLVHTTCQLPDKPSVLVDACYDNYKIDLKNFSLDLVNKTSHSSVRLLHLPKLQMTYGSLVQPQHWKVDEVPKRKFDLNCENFSLEFSKRDLIITDHLVRCILKYHPYMVWKLAKYGEQQLPATEKLINLQCKFTKFYIYQRQYHTYNMLNASLEEFNVDVVCANCVDEKMKHKVFTTAGGLRKTYRNWLEVYVQIPNEEETNEGEQVLKTVVAAWMEPYNIYIDNKMLEFLKCYEEFEIIGEKEPTVDAEAQVQVLQTTINPTVTIKPNNTRAMLNPLNATTKTITRRSSRHSLSKKITQPEETIHVSSERDEKVDIETSVSTPPNSKDETQHEWFKISKALVFYIELAQSKLHICEHFLNNSEDVLSNHTLLLLPKTVLKSSLVENINRGVLYNKLLFADDKKDTLNWTIAMNSLSLSNVDATSTNILLEPTNIAFTIVATHKEEKFKKKSFGHNENKTKKTNKENVRESGKKCKTEHNSSIPDTDYSSNEEKSHSSSKKKADSTDVDIVDIYNSNDAEAMPFISHSKCENQIYKKNIYTINLHVDTTPIKFCISTQKFKILQQHVSVLTNVLDRIKVMVSPVRSSSAKVSNPFQILTATEENSKIKEFLDLETNSEISLYSEEKYADINEVSLFYQWTITKIIAELENNDESRKAKIVLELEDILSTVDKREDYSKYTSKIGHFCVNYYKLNEQNEWIINELLRIKMLGESSNLPFCNVIITTAALKNFYKKIGFKRKGELNRNIAEVLITMESLEIIMDLDVIKEFLTPLAKVCVGERTNTKNITDKTFEKENPDYIKSEIIKPITAADLPMIHLNSKGFTLYLPFDTGKESCSVLIWRIDQIQVTPNLENPLQRNPIRMDVFSKAAQMGILGTPGSVLEDRQYEMTLGNISIVTGNWNEILTHMREQTNNAYRTNPAFEWNNQNRKTTLQLSEIFNNFTFIATFAPGMTYNDILVCGQAVEFNCASDFIASLNTYQIFLLSCLIERFKHILSLTPNSVTTQRKTSASLKYIPASMDSKYSRMNSTSSTILRTNVSEQRSAQLHKEARGSVSVLDSADEVTENFVKTDSGFQSNNSRIYSTGLQERIDSNTQTLLRHVPCTVSLVAGVFVIKIFDVKQNLDDMLPIPLFSITISQPSFMYCQNIYDAVTTLSVFDLNIKLSQLKDSALIPTSNDLFTDCILETRPGDVDATGIPPPLICIKKNRTKMNLIEVDVLLSKTLIINLNEPLIKQLIQNILKVYITLLQNPCFPIRSAVPVMRATKIALIRQQFYNVDRLHFKCENIVIKFFNEKDYNCTFVLNELKANTKFLNRPEKVTINLGIAAFHLEVNHYICLHPTTVRVSAEFLSEPWHNLPLIMATVKFNVLNADIGIKELLQLQEANLGYKRLMEFNRNAWQEFFLQRPSFGVGDMQPDRLILLKAPTLKNNAHLRKYDNCKSDISHGEFYQDDLRAGAFQFVETATDSFLPLPYQIQIIKKNYGIICWRYPQPRKMFKIHVYPVPMAITSSVHIKCRMEYYSEVHSAFLHFCDFWLSETVSKEIALPEREICANIWRVVILQSVVAVNGACFENSEEDEDLKSIPSFKIDDMFKTERTDSEFLLHPKVLVGCMRIDTSFQSACVPKVQLLVSCNLFCIQLKNQPQETGELPIFLKKYQLNNSIEISQTFLVLNLKNMSFHTIFHSLNNYALDSSLICSIEYLDYGFLNMLYFLEETTIQSYIRFKNSEQSNICANFVFDKLRFNIGPSFIHTILSSKQHWQDLLDQNPKRIRNTFLPKCIVVNRTHSCLSFGQTDTTERIKLQPKECHLYSFRSEYLNQELTFFICDDDTQMIQASQSIPITLKLDGNSIKYPIRIGDKCIFVKQRKLSATQVFLLIKGQIEMISMIPNKLRLEFRKEGVNYENIQPKEYIIDENGRSSFFRNVRRNSNINIRLKFSESNSKKRSGDIPLRPNKGLPWLVKIPTDNNDFISYWVRVLREDIPELATDKFQPQKVLITIWPIFEILSMLTCPVRVTESFTKDNFQLNGEGDKHTLHVPATHLSEHQLDFIYNTNSTTTSYMLSLKSIDWFKFFKYDQQIWNIDYALTELGKEMHADWPLSDNEEKRVKRTITESGVTADIIYNAGLSRDFSCTLCLELTPWALLINATGLNIGFCNLTTNERISLESNCLTMIFATKGAFTIDIRNGTAWFSSKPIYLLDANNDVRSGKHSVLASNSSIDIVIQRSGEVLHFVLLYTIEKERRVLKLCTKYVITNFSKHELYVLSFAMDHKESSTRECVRTLDMDAKKLHLKTVMSATNCIGLNIDSFYDLNVKKSKRTNDTAFVYFVCIKFSNDSEISIPIPLSMPFTRRCLSIQNESDSLPFVVTLIEKNGIHYLNVFDDISPSILFNNQTDIVFVVAQTKASENSKVSSTVSEYHGRHFDWFQLLPAHSNCFYTPPEMYINFPDIESSVCNLTIALYDDQIKKNKICWSKPISTDKSWEKFLHIPNHGDVKIIICDKHRVIRFSIYYITEQTEFSVKDLRSRLLTSHPPLDAETKKHSNLMLDYKNSSVSSGLFIIHQKCSHFSEELQQKMTTNVKIFIKEVNFCLNTDSKDRDYVKREIFALYGDDFLLSYEDESDKRQLNIAFTNLQIDNQLYTSGKYDFPVVLCAQDLYKRTNSMPQVHDLDQTYRNLESRSFMALFVLNFYNDEFKLCSIKCSFSPIRTYIEDAYLNDLLDAMVECEPSNCVFVPTAEELPITLQAGENLLPRDVAAQAICISEPLQLRSFRIEPLSVLLSVHTSVRLYIALDHSPLSFGTYEREHIITAPLRFGQSLGMHYLSGAIFGAGWVVGSLEILGSPSGLARSFTTGLRDFVSMPVQGLFRGPWGFIVGITQGSASLLRNVTAGTVNSVTKLAASVARNLDRLTLDTEHLERTEALRRTRPQGFTEGFTQGITGFGISLLGAVGGIARHTLEARSPVEVVTGVGKGIVGAFTKPISGAAELVALTGQGMLQSVGFNAMPQQRMSSLYYNKESIPSAYRIWKLLPGVLSTDQILAYHEVTLLVPLKTQRAYIFLTSAVFAALDAQWDKLLFACPVDKVEILADRNDKTLVYVRVAREKEDIEEDMDYTNQRILSFLHSSFISRERTITADSLDDMLQSQDGSEEATRNLECAFYINENIGEHLIQYLKIMHRKL